ncbi:hypothetical protein ABXJ56_06190 [Microbacterium chocolatum]|uniref:hypothetical protein n=1 Tax=Microbacterium aurantiacum TaxID=162393 RepID=UPI00338D9E37
MNDEQQVSDAIVFWIGHGDAVTPIRNDDRVREEYGADVGERLLLEIHQLEEDFYQSDAHVVAPDLQSMMDSAKADFRILHPHIPRAAVDALGWAYAFDYK